MEYDVVIVGSGPSGMSAARTLIGSGLRVAVVERLSDAGMPRYHSICGGGVSREGAGIVGARDDEVLNDIRTLRIKWPGGVVLDIGIDGVIIDRPKLLSRIRGECAEAGVEVIRDTVRDVLLLGDACRTITASGNVLASRYVIGADGAYSAVRKGVFGTEPAEMTPVEEYRSEEPCGDGVFEFDVGQKYGGIYEWHFPCGTGSTSGSKLGLADAAPGAKRMVRTIPTGGVPDIVKGNVLLAGDAGGLTNPVTYGGLRIAFESGREAAKAVIAGDPSAYSDWWSGSKYSDPRFMELHKAMSTMSDADYEDFSKAMTHRSFAINGICSVLRRPKYAWMYFGGLMCVRHGW